MLANGRGRLAAWSLVLAAGLGLAAPSCPDDPFSQQLVILQPVEDQLSLVDDVAVHVRIPGGADQSSLVVELDGADVSGHLSLRGVHAEGVLPHAAAGPHVLEVRVEGRKGGSAVASRSFETIELDRPDECEILNQEECLLPYPSDRFRERGPEGWALVLPQSGIPKQLPNREIPASHLRVRDGFSPTVQVLMHFPQGVDLEQSGAARLHAEPSRSTDLTSLAPDSPSVLLEGGPPGRSRRILHWLENDVRPDVVPGIDPARRILFLRPGHSLTPGEHYIVALRNLVDAGGDAVEAEPVFAALRDGRPTDIPAVEARRAHFEHLFLQLALNGIPRESLVLAFDFSVASDHNLTGQMLSMRDQAFAWLAAQDQSIAPTFTVNDVDEYACSGGQRIWREVRGRFQVPLFLDKDPETLPIPAGYLQVGPDGFAPVWATTTNPEYGISIPCAALEDPATTPVHPIVIGHGLFGNGPNTAIELADGISQAEDAFGLGFQNLIAGGTHWRGMSTRDFRDPTSGPSFIVNTIVFNLANFPALPDRLRQGQLNQLVLARMMKTGAFNAHPAFQAPAGHGVFRPGEETYYFGASLGGILGLMFAALTPDVTRLNVDVPAINFSILLQRATPFILFQFALDLTISTDPMIQSLGIQLLHEMWVTGESAGYATHITENPLPGTNAKQILMTMAFLDQQVSNQATEIAARTLGLPSLEGSLLPGLPLIPDEPGPLPSALVVYDTASFDLANPDHEIYIPPLWNLPAEPHDCDPHGRRGYIPASLMQLAAFLQPGGEIESFCDGLCDADLGVAATGPGGNVYHLEIPNGDGFTCPGLP